MPTSRGKSIVANTTPLNAQLTGVGRYIYEVLRPFAELDCGMDVTFYNGCFSKELTVRQPLTPDSRSLAKQVLRQGRFWGSRLWTRAVRSHQRFDLYWEPNHIPLDAIRADFLVTTVHDLSVALHPQWHPRKRLEYFNKYFERNVRRSDRLITVSHFIKNQIVEHLGFPADRIHTIPLGVRHRIFRPLPPEQLKDMSRRKNLQQPFVLFVGSVEPRKNIAGAIHAYQRLPNRLKNQWKFVVCGFEGWNNADVLRLMDKNRENIVYLGYLNDQELAYVYNLATVFIFPSFYEGFGLPVLEAMACGTPVIASDTASLPEVCGTAARLVDPNNIEEMTAALEEFLTNDDLRRSFAARGLQHARNYTWHSTATSHLALFRSLFT